MKVIVLCAHEEIDEYVIRNKKGEVTIRYRMCAECLMPEGTDPIITVEGEMLPWWGRDQAIYEKEKRDRVHIEERRAERFLLRDMRNELTEALDMERRVFGADSDDIEWMEGLLVDTLDAIERHWP